VDLFGLGNFLTLADNKKKFGDCINFKEHIDTKLAIFIVLFLCGRIISMFVGGGFDPRQARPVYSLVPSANLHVFYCGICL